MTRSEATAWRMIGDSENANPLMVSAALLRASGVVDLQTMTRMRGRLASHILASDRSIHETEPLTRSLFAYWMAEEAAAESEQ